MDALDELLAGHRARGAFLLRCVMAPPWSVLVADRAAVAVLVAVRGEVHVVRAGEPPRCLLPGDVAVLKGTPPYALADHPATAPTAVVEPGQVCRRLDGSGAAPDLVAGPRSWGNADAATAPCAFVTAVYELPGQVTGRLLRAVPDTVVVPAADADLAAARLLAAEFDVDAPGQDVVLDRLADLVLVSALRAWCTSAGAAAPAWWRATADPSVGAALRLMRERPAEPWTLHALAAAVAVSRATLARRFTALVGEPPAAHLTRVRLDLAADLLTGTGDTVEAIGRRVGYANPFAFSTAFKRHTGQAPRTYRRTGTSPGGAAAARSRPASRSSPISSAPSAANASASPSTYAQTQP